MNETFMKEKPVLPLLLSMALPNVLSMLVNSLYNIVDSLFVARISEDAMTALSLVFPIQNFSNAIAIGFGIGINAMIALYLGAGDREKAETAATHGFVLSLNHLPPLAPGDILLHGHTHVPAWTDFGQGNLYLNPGSVSIPKENTAHSYMTLEGSTACWKTMEGACYHQLQL